MADVVMMENHSFDNLFGALPGVDGLSFDAQESRRTQIQVRRARQIRCSRSSWPTSPLAAPGGVTSVVHDHTSVLATIEANWNLPALTDRDANAETVTDFLTPEKPPAERPALVAPQAGTPSGPVTPPGAPAPARR